MPPPSQSDATVAKAAAWLASTTRAERGGAAIPELQRRFGLSLKAAVAVVRENNLRLARAT